jgi:hypothetical protein
MTMRNPLNRALFAHDHCSTDAFNSLCTIVHQLDGNGAFAGEVMRGKRLVGTFALRFDEALASHQVHIDLAAFDPPLARGRTELGVRPAFEVGGKGFLVFHTSGERGDFRVRLQRRDDGAAEVAYDTAELAAGDMVVFRLWNPGMYLLKQSGGSHDATIRLRLATDGKYPSGLGKLSPVHAKLTARGFEPRSIELWPLQALIVHLEGPGIVKVELVEETKPMPLSTKGRH